MTLHSCPFFDVIISQLVTFQLVFKGSSWSFCFSCPQSYLEEFQDNVKSICEVFVEMQPLSSIQSHNFSVAQSFRNMCSLVIWRACCRPSVNSLHSPQQQHWWCLETHTSQTLSD